MAASSPPRMRNTKLAIIKAMVADIFAAAVTRLGALPARNRGSCASPPTVYALAIRPVGDFSRLGYRSPTPGDRTYRGWWRAARLKRARKEGTLRPRRTIKQQ